MTLTFELSPEAERRLASRAAAQGQDVTAYVRQLVERDLGPAPSSAPPHQATLDLLTRWDAEDGTDDRAEVDRRQAEWEDLKRALNNSRGAVGARKLFP